MKSGLRQIYRPARDTGLNSSDLAADAESLHPGSRKVQLLTPLASFSSEELARLRRTSPDAYQALLQYEQLCRHDTAVIEAKETELQRCIEVGQEVLGQLDQLKTRCSQLAGERDKATAKIRELQQLLKRLEATPNLGADDHPSPAIKGGSRKMELSLREQLRQQEEEKQKLHVYAKKLERELQEQQLLHDTLKRDLESAVQTARLAGAGSEAAETARRSAEASLQEMRLRVEEKERELLRANAAQREAEENLRERQQESAKTLALYRDSQKPSVEMVTAASMLVTLHNQLQELILDAGRSHNTKRELSPVAVSQLTRLRLPTAATVGATADSSLTPVQLGQWFAHSLEETSHLVLELTRALQQLEERLRRRDSDLERATAERQLALDKTNNLGRENEQLRLSLVALKEEVQALDAQTDRLREFDTLEVQRQTNLRIAAIEEEKRAEKAALQFELEQTRRQGALELANLHEDLETERRTMEREIRSLRSEINRLHEEEKSAVSAAGRVAAALASPAGEEQLQVIRQQQIAFQGRVEELEAENQRLRAKTSQEMAELRAENARLEQVVQSSRSRYQRQLQKHEDEMEKMIESKQELQRRLCQQDPNDIHRIKELQNEVKCMRELECKLRGELLKARTELESNTEETEKTMAWLRERQEAELAQVTHELETLRRGMDERNASLIAENAELREKLEQAQCSKETELGAKDSTIATLNRQLCDAEIEAAKMQDAIHRSSQKAKGLATETVPVDRYEEIETELMQEREHVQALVGSLNAAQTNIEELRGKLEEQKQCVQDCLRQLPPSPAKQFARVALLLQETAKRATTRLLAILEEPRSVSIPSLSPPREGSDAMTLRIENDDSPEISVGIKPLDFSPVIRLPTTPRGIFPKLPSQQSHGEPSSSRTLSPPTSTLEDDLSPPSRPGVWKHYELAAAFSGALHTFLSDLTSSVEQVSLRPYAFFWESLERLQRLFIAFSPVATSTKTTPTATSSTNTNPANTTPEAQVVATDGKNDNIRDIGAENDNVNVSGEETGNVHHEDINDDAMWAAIAGGVVDAYVDECAAVFKRLYHSTTIYLREREETFQKSSHHLNMNCEERVRRMARGMTEREQGLSMQLATAHSKAAAAQRFSDEAYKKLEDITSRYNEVCTRVEHLEEQLAAKKRELETERRQWQETVAKLQLKRAARRQGDEGRQEQLLRQVEELRAELQNVQTQLNSAREEEQRIRRDADNTKELLQRDIHRLERELLEARNSQNKTGQALHDIREQLAASNLTLQQRQNDEMSRARQAERTIEALQQEISEARTAHQSTQRLWQAEKFRGETAEEHAKDLSRQLAEKQVQIETLEQRVAELQESWWLQQKAFDAMTEENGALQKVNRVLEERLAKVESEREPLRQQLQSLLLLEPR
ncbi:hypothetical protein MOQ_003360 [Trypanosoma cruzi marinkellei]|uniref:Uncharacterized protein n=1 Tax=Trypanosoma cruzi marinkellei TaxID=85056 RepID=K2NUW7_TRYCR|nr:hypothetical protein MOQ_003360 [Trypanosoma cruzi marinkellei]